MSRALILVLMVLACSGYAQNGQKGMIGVKVVNEHGVAVPGATVRWYFLPGRMLMHPIPECQTDARGFCMRDDLAMDTYVIRAMKPSDGYPDTAWDFYSHETQSAGGVHRPPTVVLTPRHRKEVVTVAIGPKAGVLTIHVVDAGTSVQIANASIMLRNAKDSNDFLGVSKTLDSTVLVPPDEDIQIEIIADGYRPLTQSEHPEAFGSKVIRLQSAERREISINLERK